MHVCIYCRYLDKTTTNEVERVQEVPMTHEKVRERAKRERGRGQKRECVQGRNKCVQEGAGRRRDRHAGERDGEKKTYLSVHFDLIFQNFTRDQDRVRDGDILSPKHPVPFEGANHEISTHIRQQQTP